VASDQQINLFSTSSLFWDVMQRRRPVSYRISGTVYRSQTEGSSSPRRMPATVRYAVPKCVP